MELSCYSFIERATFVTEILFMIYCLHFQKQCVTYVCAPSKVNVSGQCKPVFKKMKNIGLDYKVAYRFLIGSDIMAKLKYEEITTEMALHDNASHVVVCHQETKTESSFREPYVTYSTLVIRNVREMTAIEDIYDIFKENTLNKRIVTTRVSATKVTCFNH